MDYTMERLKIDEVNEMKYLSIAIPCYNSEDYMDRAIQSLLPGEKMWRLLL